MLSNVKILDFTSTLPGPFATMILADMGAEVIRIEHPDQVDIVNIIEPRIGEESGAYRHINRNKSILKLDLKNKSAQQQVYDYLDEYDIIIEGFRPGTMKKFNLDYTTVRKYNSSIIYLSLTGYGQTGPKSSAPGHDINFLALSGIAKLLGIELPSLQLGDIGGSLYAVIGLLGAIINRMKTGEGQYIDVSMLDTTMTLAPLQFPSQLIADREVIHGEQLLDGGSYYDFYETLDNQYIAIGSLETKFFIRLMNTLDLDVDPHSRFTDTSIKPKIKKSISRKRLESWIEIFASKDICVEPVYAMEEVQQETQIKTRKMIVEVGDDGEKQVAHPLKYSSFKPSYRHHKKL